LIAAWAPSTLRAHLEGSVGPLAIGSLVPDPQHSLPSLATPPLAPQVSRAPELDRLLWDQIERATGSPTLVGNQIRLQFEGSASFDAWLEAIEGARRFVYFENYVVRDDRVGRAFREALIAKAHQGVPVFVIHDWLGCWATPRRYWRPLREAGVQVRAFNPPSLAIGDPLGVLQRDHRKLVVADGEVAFVGGFCIGEEWTGSRSRPPWRDTGVEIRGPAAHAAALAFERLWGEMGLPTDLASASPPPAEVGSTPVWIIEGEPGKARVYRTLHLSAARARGRLWLTDAYFVAPRSVSEALAAAARQGVDVRILVPAHNNWPLVGSLSRGGYRFLLESGVRLFEWQGPMIHAKTAVVDGSWCRVGSSNLNGASLMGNWELDVGVFDPGLARQLEGLFLADLASSREIVLPGRALVAVGRLPGEAEPPKASLDPKGTLPERLEQQFRSLGSGGSGRGAGMAPLVRAGSLLGGALAGNRTLGREDRTVLGTLSVAILMVAAAAAFFPMLVGWCVAVLTTWFGVVTGIRALAQARRARAQERRAALAARLNSAATGESPWTT
jgi:cardiolipin synthase A/B